MPKGAKILCIKWDDGDANGKNEEVVRFEARTAMCTCQRRGFDYFDTYALVMRTKTSRVLLKARHPSPDHEMGHWIIKVAFTTAMQEEGVWIRQLDSDQQEIAEGMVSQHKRALYNLNQAGRAWEKLLKSIIFETGFTQLMEDKRVFIIMIMHTTSGGWCVVGTHVDDLFPVFSSQGRMHEDNIFQALERHVKLDDEGLKCAKNSDTAGQEAGVDETTSICVRSPSAFWV